MDTPLPPSMKWLQVESLQPKHPKNSGNDGHSIAQLNAGLLSGRKMSS
jgi:hypothetical protein